MSESRGCSIWGFTDVLRSDEVEYISFESRFDINRQTRRINFNTQLILKDYVLAHGCVVVMTNDGENGTLSHLTTYNNGKQFVADLRDELGSNIPVCIVGGEKHLVASRALVHTVIENLQHVGFKLKPKRPYSDVLGYFLRQSILTKTGVEVRRLSIPSDVEFSHIIKLRFPQ